MPYSNFDDTCSINSTFHENQQEDTDMNIGEFLFNKLLTIGELFDEGEDEDGQVPPNDHQNLPIQIQPLQSGSLFCIKLTIPEQEKKQVPEKPTCLFRDNMFSFDFHASIFHPPAIAC